MLEGQDLEVALTDDAKVSSEAKHGTKPPGNVHSLHPLQDGAQLKAEEPVGQTSPLSQEQQAQHTEQMSFSAFTLQSDAQIVITSKAVTLALLQIAHQYINEGLLHLPAQGAVLGEKEKSEHDKAIKKAMDKAQQALSMACDSDAVGTKPTLAARLAGAVPAVPQKLDAQPKPH